MLQNNRVLWKHGQALIDLSLSLSDYLSSTPLEFPLLQNDAIFIGSDLPFNHRWFEVTSPNALTSKPSVEIWNGNAWKPAVDVIDQTAVNGKSFAKPGILSWMPDKYQTWGLETSTEDIPELSSLKIYDLYWVKITFSASLTEGTQLKYIGHRFSTDTELFARYSNLSNEDLIDAFQEDKRNWTDQHFIAAEELVEHLRANRTILSPNQILRWEQFKTAALHKCAEVIYRSFGQAYSTEMKDAMAAFMKAMEIGSQNIDKNQNGVLDWNERSSSTEFMDR